MIRLMPCLINTNFEKKYDTQQMRRCVFLLFLAKIWRDLEDEYARSLNLEQTHKAGFRFPENPAIII